MDYSNVKLGLIERFKVWNERRRAKAHGLKQKAFPEPKENAQLEIKYQEVYLLFHQLQD